MYLNRLGLSQVNLLPVKVQVEFTNPRVFIDQSAVLLNEVRVKFIMRILRGALSIAFLVFASFLFSPGCGDGTDERVDAGCEDAFCIGMLFRTSDSPSSVIKAAELARDDINN